MTESIELKEIIDGDEGLRSKRRLLVVTSIILLAIQFSGAKIIEANTLILKLSFTHYEGVEFLLTTSVFFLLVRYYNYAAPYHRQLYDVWTARMLADLYFYSYDYHGDSLSGLIKQLKPDGFDFEHFRHEERLYWNYSYVCSGLFKRAIRHQWNDVNQDMDDLKSLGDNVSICVYLHVLCLELKYQTSSFFVHRENLDIYSPYLLGALAIIFSLSPELIKIVL